MQKMELSYCWEHGEEKSKNKLVKWKAVVDTVGIKSADLKDSFAAFCLEWFEIKVSSDRFG